MEAVAIADNPNIEMAIADALGHLRLASLIQGKLVAVKPNDTWASPADRTGVTQPDTLRAVLREIKRYGPLRWSSPEEPGPPKRMMSSAWRGSWMS